MKSRISFTDQSKSQIKHIGGIISVILRSSSPFGKAYRKHLADIKKGGSVCVQ